jgi:alginate O-acetyltransferase complex protein AlgI
MARRFGVAAGVWGVFLVSGLAHEAVISVPAGAGFGGPTLYFAVQGAAMLWESGSPAGSGVWRRLRALAVLVVPLPLLFHASFVTGVCQPFFEAIHALP